MCSKRPLCRRKTFWPMTGCRLSVPPVNHRSGVLPLLQEVVPTANASMLPEAAFWERSGSSPTMTSASMDC